MAYIKQVSTYINTLDELNTIKSAMEIKGQKKMSEFLRLAVMEYSKSILAESGIQSPHIETQ